MRELAAILSIVAAGTLGCNTDGDTAEPIAELGSIAVVEAYAPAPIMPETAALYFTLQNRATEPDTILSVSVDVADSATLHTQVMAGSSMRMSPLANMPVPALGAARLTPGGNHVMLTALRGAIVEGDEIHVEVTLARAGTIAFSVPVLTYEQVAERVQPVPPHESTHR